MIRLVHLSDLHFCTHSMRNHLNDIISSLKGVKLLSPDKIRYLLEEGFTYNDQRKLDPLLSAIKKLNPLPDLLCITGDITTFGDPDSFDEALTFIRRLEEIDHNLKLIVIPGNHDNFSSAWAVLLQKLDGQKLFLKTTVNIFARQVIRAVRSALPDLQSYGEPFSAYNSFLQKLGADHNRKTIPDPHDPFRLAIFPFKSVNVDPFWMNTGKVFDQEWVRFKTAVSPNSDKTEIRVVMIHHNPLSAPSIKAHPIVVAYNSTVDASTILNELQTRGVDLLLCGHEHSWATYSVDFNSDKVNNGLLVAHAPAATAEDDTKCGFSVIDFNSRHSAQLTHYAYRLGEYRADNKPRSLFLGQDTIQDTTTLYAHSEFRQFFYKKDDVENLFHQHCDDLIRNATKDVIIIGQTLRNFSRYGILHDIVVPKITAGVNFMICVMDPDKLIVESDQAEKLGLFLDCCRTDFVNEAQSSLLRLRAFKEEIAKKNGSDVACRIKIGRIPRVVPIGVSLHTDWRDESYLDGEMWLEVLPISVWTEEAHARLHLKQKCNYALFSFYLQFAKQLVAVARFDE